jgi:D-alanyl-D-alanine carboxypeptidase/D-alanyl-D-alanine-endopeptidase (penicillin-binding protein 4)
VSANLAELRAELQRLVTHTGWNGDAWSVLAVSLDNGDTLFAHNAERSLAPASNVKLFTTAAALYFLGPDFRYTTFLMADGDIADGMLIGDLVLYGTGDPTIADRFGTRRSVWQAFADTLLALGVTRVTGDVVGDASYFGGSGTGEGWQTSYMNASYAAPASALSYAENVATVQVKPGVAAGMPPEVSLVPGGEGIAMRNEATTVAGGRSSIRVARSAYDGPVVVSGRIARGAAPIVRAVVVSDPERFAAAALRYELQERGIAVDGAVRSARTPEESPVTGRSVFAPAFEQRAPLRVVAVHTSPPLIDILSIINHKSHNQMAEQALRTVGRVVTGSGTVDGGARGVQAMMVQQLGGPADPALHIADGSGLSVLNRASAASFVRLLDAMARSPMWTAYQSTLPQAGAPGGLRRMYRTAAEGNLRAKTGTINHVSALSGYVQAANGERIAFSIISNNVPSTWRAKRIEDGIGSRLAAFDRALVAGEPTRIAAEPETAAQEPATLQPVAPDAPAEPARARTHTIVKGDTFEGIAKQYGVTVKALRAANSNLDPRRLMPGKTLRVPAD